MSKGRTLTLVLAVATACTRGDPSAEFLRAKPVSDAHDKAPIVATVGSRSLTTKDIEDGLASEPASTRIELAKREKRRAFVERLVRREALVQEGWTRKLYERPRVRERLERAIIEELTLDEMKALAPTNTVSEEDLRAEYDARKSELDKPEMIRLSLLLRRAQTPEEHERANAHVAHLRDTIARDYKAGDASAFAEATEKWSDDEATKLGGGDLQFLAIGDIETRFGSAAREAIARAEIGDFVVADTPEGVALLMVTGRRHAIERSFESMRAQIRGRLEREKQKHAFDAWTSDLEKKLGAKIDEAALDAIVVPSGGRDTEDDE